MPTVIKAGQSGQMLGRLSTVDLSDHLREARAFIEAARQQAAEILAAARRQDQQLRHAAQEEARREGFERGMAEGREAGRDQARQEALSAFETSGRAVVTSFQTAAEEFEKAKTQLAIDAERHVLELAVSIASKLTLAIGRQRSEATVENFRRALALVDARTNVTVRVHPDVLAALEMYAENVVRPANPLRHVSLMADESLAPGGCRLSSERTEVDASLETQIDEMVRLLLGETEPVESPRLFANETEPAPFGDAKKHA